MKEQYELRCFRNGVEVARKTFNRLVEATIETKTDQTGSDQFEIRDEENKGSFIRGTVRKDGYIDWIRVTK